MTIPMPKKEYISIQMTTEHRNRYNILTDALLERQQSDRSYLAACYLLSADEEIFDISKPYVSFDGIDFAAIRMRVKKRFGTYNEYTAIEVGYSIQSIYLAFGCGWIPGATRQGFTPISKSEG